MVSGGTNLDEMVLNIESLWSGGTFSTKVCSTICVLCNQKPQGENSRTVAETFLLQPVHLWPKP
jgi:hypothetical protein